MKQYNIQINPVAKPRMTRSDIWNKRDIVTKYRIYCDKLRLSKIKLTPIIHVFFYIQMPKSWSKKKKNDMCFKPHQQTPDIDNLLKGVMDALCDNDAYIYRVVTEKMWSDRGELRITCGEGVE